MQPHKNTNTQKRPNQNRHRKRRPWHQSWKEPAAVSPPNVNVQAEEWGSTAEPWPDTIDESDVGKEIICAWLQNVCAADSGDELQKMEGYYDRLHTEREKWNERLNNPGTWGWGAGQPDELNDWANATREVTGRDTCHPDEHNNWAKDAALDPHQWEVHQQVNSDKTQDGPSCSRNTEQTSPSLPELVSSYAGKLKPDGRQRSYAFVQLSADAQAEKIGEMARQIVSLKRH